MPNYKTRFITILIVAIISGYFVVKLFYGEIGSGNISVLPVAVVALIFFMISAPLSVYYGSRFQSQNLKKRIDTNINTEELISKEDYDKKQG